MRTAYGIDILPEHDPYVETAEHALKVVSVTTNAGAYLVDTLPICQWVIFVTQYGTEHFLAVKYVPAWFPGAKFQREAKEWRCYADRMLEAPWKAIKQRLVWAHVQLTDMYV